MRAIVIRPEPDNAATVARLAAEDIAVVGVPLFTLEARAWDAPSPDDFDAVLLGSANAVRFAGEQLFGLAKLPAYVVGERTAEAAREAGLTVAAIGSGGLQGLVDTLGENLPRRLLRLTGEVRLSLTVPAYHAMAECTVYASRPLPLPESFPESGLVLLHSGEAARHLAGEIDRLGRRRSDLALACLAPRIAEAAGTGWRRVAVADAPSESALLALAREMCQTRSVPGLMTCAMIDDTRSLRSPRRGPSLWPALVLVLAVVAVGTALAVQRGWLDLGAVAELRVSEPAPEPTMSAIPEDSTALVARSDALTARLAEVEQRLGRVTEQADAAAGNAARAEGLLIAFASRRAIERGTPLGFLENQLKLRFGTAQPNAVTTVIEAAATPVTLEDLSQELLILTPRLSQASAGDTAWDKVRAEMGQLFVIRRDTAPSPTTPRRIERARLFLEGGNVEAAIAEVVHTPGRGAAGPWLRKARRYVIVQRALDAIENAAILEPQTAAPAIAAPAPTPTPPAAVEPQASGTF